jgi:hypothetical protein
LANNQNTQLNKLEEILHLVKNISTASRFISTSKNIGTLGTLGVGSNLTILNSKAVLDGGISID